MEMATLLSHNLTIVVILKVRDRRLTATRRGCLRQGRVESRIEIRRRNGGVGVADNQEGGRQENHSEVRR